MPRVVLFTEKKETSLLFKKLSLDLHRHAVLGQAPASDKQLVQKFGVTKFPTLFVSPAGAPLDATATSYQWTEYDGACGGGVCVCVCVCVCANGCTCVTHNSNAYDLTV